MNDSSSQLRELLLLRSSFYILYSQYELFLDMIGFIIIDRF